MIPQAERRDFQHLALTVAWVLGKLADKGYVAGAVPVITEAGKAEWPHAEVAAKCIGRDRFAALLVGLGNCDRGSASDIAELASCEGLIGDFDGVRVPGKGGAG